MSDSLKKTMVNALKWSAVDRTLQQGVQFVIGIVLARLLCPADYGLIGMIMIFAQIAYVMVESGLGSALLRTKDITETHYNTMFITNLAISVLMYLILFFASPAIAAFFNQPELIQIARITFLAILFNAFYLVPYNHINREMDYKSLAKVNFSSTIISGAIGITLAMGGYGVWALVAQQVCYHFFRMIAFYILTRWKPSLLFSWKILRGYASFSAHILGNTLLTVIFNNIYTFLLGKLYPVKQVGLYTQANKMSETVNFTFISILTSAYRMFSKINEQKERVARILRSMTQKTSILFIPVILVLAVVARPLFVALLGPQWEDSVIYFQLLCISNIFTPMYQLNVHALNALGLSRTTFYIEVIKKVMILASIGICLWLDYSIIYMLGLYAVICWFTYFLSEITIKAQLDITFIQQFTDVSAALLTAVVLSIPCLLLDKVIGNVYMLFCTDVAITVILYITIVWLFRRDIIDEIKNMVKGEIEK